MPTLHFSSDAEAVGMVISIGDYESWELLDIVAAIRTQIPAVPFTSPKPHTARTVDFGTGPLNISLLGGATATQSNGGMTVVAPYQNSAAAMIMEEFTEGRILFTLKRGAFILGWHKTASNNGWAIWSESGNIIRGLGYLTASAAGNFVLPSASLPGVNGDVIHIEVETGPNVQGSPASIRAWLDGQARPEVAISSGTYAADGTYGGVPMNAGCLSVTTYGSTPVTLLSVKIEDGITAPAATQATFNGRWLPRWESGLPAMSTTRAGASFRVQVTGSDKLYGKFTRSPNSSANPVLAVFNGDQFVRHVQIAASGEIELISGLDPAALSQIEVFVSGVNQVDSKWRWSSGVQLNALRMDSGRLDPWPDTRPTAIWHGDSITEGSSAKTGQGNIPLNSCGECTYAVLASKTLGLSPIINGFGGLGLSVAGSGAWPAFPVSSNWYMHGRQVTDESPDYVFISFGTNEANVTFATMRANLVAAVNDQRVKYPTAQVVLVVPPTGAQKPANVQAAYDTGAKLIDLSGILVSGDTTDGVHPTPAGHAKLANALVSQYQAF